MPPREAVEDRLDVSTAELLNVRRRRTSNQQTGRKRRMPANKSDATTMTPTWVSRVWHVHFVLSFSVLVVGHWANRPSRKYIPLDVSLLPISCRRAFLDTLSASADAPGALLCCDNSTEGVCYRSLLPLGKRLARFPEAWLLPLFPLVVGLVYRLWQEKRHWHYFSHLPTVIRRLGLYLFLMVVRGAILYQGMNQVERFLLQFSSRNNDNADCWYHNPPSDVLLGPAAPTHSCHAFDFSDHVVLYMAQILPICLAELLEGLQQVPPLPGPRRIVSATTMSLLASVNGISNSNSNNTTAMEDSPQRRRWSRSLVIHHVVALTGSLYLYGITQWGAYRTTAYFHTAPEVFMGFAVSFLLSWPLYCLQCCNSSWLGRVHEWLFGAG